MLTLAFAVPTLLALAVAALLVAANVRGQPRPIVGVHGLRWLVLHGLWAPAGGWGLGGIALRVGLLHFGFSPVLALGAAAEVLPIGLPLAFDAVMTIAWAAVLGTAAVAAPWWASELTAGADGVRVTGRWPRPSTALPWSTVRAVRVVGRDLVIEGEELVVLPMAWGPKALLHEVALALETTRRTASPPAMHPPQAPPPPELAWMRLSAGPRG